MTKRNFDATLKNLDGTEIVENGKTVLCRTVVVNALLANDDAAPGIKKAERFNLANRLYAGGDIDLTVEELVEIKELVGKYFPPLTVGQVYALIEKEVD